MKKNVFVFSRLSPEHQERLRRNFNVTVLDPTGDIDAQYAAVLPEAHGLLGVGRPFGRAQLERAGQLEVISTISVGYDNYELAYLNERGILLTNTPDVLTETTADLGFTLLMAAARRVPELDAWVKAGHWQAPVGPAQFGTDVHGKTLGILGLGRIGEAVARRAMACGMQIRYHNRRKKDVAYPYDPDPVALAKNSDVLMIVTPGGAETKNLVNARVLDALGPQGYLVNIARGSVVDEPVLLKYLQEKKIAGAGLDVFADEPRVPPAFFTLDNAVIFPHVASATVETRKAMGDLQIENLRLHFAGKPVRTRVV